MSIDVFMAVYLCLSLMMIQMPVRLKKEKNEDGKETEASAVHFDFGLSCFPEASPKLGQSQGLSS